MVELQGWRLVLWQRVVRLERQREQRRLEQVVLQEQELERQLVEEQQQQGQLQEWRQELVLLQQVQPERQPLGPEQALQLLVLVQEPRQLGLLLVELQVEELELVRQQEQLLVLE